MRAQLLGCWDGPNVSFHGLLGVPLRSAKPWCSGQPSGDGQPSFGRLSSLAIG